MRRRFSSSARPRFAGVVLALVLAALAGCQFITGMDGEWRRRVGVITLGDSTAWENALVAPDSAEAGQTFQVTVATSGSRSCTRPSGAEVAYSTNASGLVAEITPYDRYHEGVVCTADLSTFPRTVELRFNTPGEATVRVRGRRWFGMRSPDTEIITVEQRIAVR